MNISISSLIFASIIASPSAFINNKYSVSKISIQKFTPIIFYNQQSLDLKESVFKNGLSSTIYNNKDIIPEGNHITVKEYGKKYSKKEGLIIYIKGSTLSIYITQSYFYQCLASSSKGIVELSRVRCLTLTHTCVYGPKVQGTRSFLYYDCVLEDFSLCLYSTFAKVEAADSDNYKDANLIYCQSGNQHYRCNNITEVLCNA